MFHLGNCCINFDSKNIGAHTYLTAGDAYKTIIKENSPTSRNTRIPAYCKIQILKKDSHINTSRYIYK